MIDARGSWYVDSMRCSALLLSVACLFACGESTSGGPDSETSSGEATGESGTEGSPFPCESGYEACAQGAHAFFEGCEEMGGEADVCDPWLVTPAWTFPCYAERSLHMAGCAADCEDGNDEYEAAFGCDAACFEAGITCVAAAGEEASCQACADALSNCSAGCQGG